MGIYKSEKGGQAVRERYLKFLERWPVANRQFQVPTSQGETFVVECGNSEGPPVILLHGGAANSAMWMGDIAAWAPEFRIFAVDVIGEPGLSAPARPALNSDTCALWLFDVMSALSLARASFIGVSLGGWLALDYATRRPERVTSLVAMCPGGIGRQKNRHRAKDYSFAAAGPLGQAQGARDGPGTRTGGAFPGRTTLYGFPVFNL